MSAQLRPGYKQTEAGVIPADWSPHTIGDLVDFEGGSQPDKSVFRQSWKAGYVRLIQIRDYKTDKYETYIPWSLARRFCNESDIMIGRYGPPVFQILRGIDGAYNVALIKAKPCPAINNSYAYYFLKQEKLFAFIEKLSRRSSGQTGVDLKELRQYPLPLPSIEEQETIAEALSDADALIELLEQLLAKKRHLKQGTMQELLTGKKRLPGFSASPYTQLTPAPFVLRGACLRQRPPPAGGRARLSWRRARRHAGGQGSRRAGQSGAGPCSVVARLSGSASCSE